MYRQILGDVCGRVQCDRGVTSGKNDREKGVLPGGEGALFCASAACDVCAARDGGRCAGDVGGAAADSAKRGTLCEMPPRAGAARAAGAVRRRRGRCGEAGCAGAGPLQCCRKRRAPTAPPQLPLRGGKPSARQRAGDRPAHRAAKMPPFLCALKTFIPTARKASGQKDALRFAGKALKGKKARPGNRTCGRIGASDERGKAGSGQSG